MPDQILISKINLVPGSGAGRGARAPSGKPHATGHGLGIGDHETGSQGWTGPAFSTMGMDRQEGSLCLNAFSGHIR